MIKRLIKYLVIKRRTEYIQYESSLKSNNARNYTSYSTLKAIRLKFRQKSIYCLIVIVIYCDNQKAQAFVKNFINYFRIKHINIQHHFVREKIIKKQI